MFYLIEKLFPIVISEISLCYLCNQNNKTIEHLFCHCFFAKALWSRLNNLFENHLSLYDLATQTAFFGFKVKHLDVSISQDHLLLVFEINLYKPRSYGFACL